MNFGNPLAVVLVTGAAGKTGQAVLRKLGAEGLSVRALVRGAAQRAVVEALGVAQVAEGDLLDDGTILPPEGPGIGVAPDEDRIEELTRRAKVFL